MLCFEELGVLSPVLFCFALFVKYWECEVAN